MLPISLKLENFVCHGSSFLNLESISAAMIVGEIDGSHSNSNGAGKSTIFEAICWALYGQCKTSLLDKIVRSGQDKCTVEFIFEVAGDRYKIIRRRKRDTSSDVRLSIRTGEGWSDISGNNVKGTAQKIIHLVKFNYDTFTNSIFFRQKSLMDFAEKIPSEKLALLKQLLYLFEYDQYKKISKDSASKIKNSVESATQIASIYQQDFAKKASFEIELVSTTQQSALIDIDIVAKAEQRSLLLNRKAQLESSSAQVQTLNKLLLDYNNSRVSLEAKQKDLHFLCQEINSINLEQLKNLWSLEYTNHQKLIAEHISFNTEQTNFNLSEIHKQIGMTDKQISDAKKALINLSAVDGQCFVCQSPLDEQQKTKLQSDRQSDLILASEELLKLGKQRVALESELEKHNIRGKSIERSKYQLDTIQKQIESYDVKLRERDLKDGMVKESIEHHNALIDQINNLKSTMVSGIDGEINYLQGQVKALDNDLITQNNLLNSCRMQQGRLMQSIEACQQQQDKLLQASAEIDTLQYKLSVEEYVSNLFADIPKLIINSALEEIETVTNQILSDISLTPMSVNIVQDTFEIDVVISGDSQSFDMLSVGQQTRVSIALRLALSQILANRSGGQIKFLLLDEVSSYLDDGAIENLAYIVTKLAEKFKILLVSHDERLKDYFSNIITVSMKDRVSTIIQ